MFFMEILLMEKLSLELLDFRIFKERNYCRMRKILLQLLWRAARLSVPVIQVIMRKVAKSPRKFNVKEFSAEEKATPSILLKDLQDQPAYSEVSVKAKVMNVDRAMKVSGGLTKQDVTIADSTAPARLTLWESDIDSLEEFDSYSFESLTVRVFKGQKYLTTQKEGSTIKKIDDMEDIAEEELPTDGVTIQGAEIIGVQSLQKYVACVSCNAKVEVIDDKMGSCSKCDMYQAVNRCKRSYQRVFLYSMGTNM